MARGLHAKGTIIVARGLERIRLVGEEGLKFLSMAEILLEAMQAFIFMDTDLGGQDILEMEFTTVPSVHSVFGSRPVIFKFASSSHGQIMA